MFKKFCNQIFQQYRLKFLKNTIKRTKTAMTGIQPTGIPHIGNYLGPIKECLSLKADSSIEHVYISIVDLHALTSINTSETMSVNIDLMAASLMACGIGGSNISIFQQSRILQHASLAWVLMCLCPLNRVQHLPQWKDKLHNMSQEKSANAGLLMYPVLQAADIILYSPTIVPVGEDQIVHLELARYLRTKLIHNSLNISHNLENYFPNPEMKLCTFPKIYSLRKPGKKMSKSDPDPYSRIELMDTPDSIRNKIKKAVTDSETGNVIYDPEKRPALANLINIYAALKKLVSKVEHHERYSCQSSLRSYKSKKEHRLTLRHRSISDGSLWVMDNDVSPETAISDMKPLTKVEFKDLLSEELIRSIEPIRLKINQFVQNKTEINKILLEGHEKASQKAKESMDLIWRSLDMRTFSTSDN